MHHVGQLALNSLVGLMESTLPHVFHDATLNRRHGKPVNAWASGQQQDAGASPTTAAEQVRLARGVAEVLGLLGQVLEHTSGGVEMQRSVTTLLQRVVITLCLVRSLAGAGIEPCRVTVVAIAARRFGWRWSHGAAG